MSKNFFTTSIVYSRCWRQGQWSTGICGALLVAFALLCAPASGGAESFLDRKIFTGDFYGDSREEALIYSPSMMMWHVFEYNTTNKTHSFRAILLPFDTIEWGDFLAGDFDGDGKIELAARNKQTGNIYRARANAVGTFSTQYLSSLSATVSWADMRAIDIDGDSADEIIARESDHGIWWLSDLNDGNGSPIALANWASDVIWKDAQIGDFDGDGRQELVARLESQGIWYMLDRNTTGATSTTAFGVWDSSSTWTHVVAGDFDGNGSDELAGFSYTTGTWWRSQREGAALAVNHLMAQWKRNSVWSAVVVGKFNTSSLDRIIGVERTSGLIWEIERDTKSPFGTNFTSYPKGRLHQNLRTSPLAPLDPSGTGNVGLLSVENLRRPAVAGFSSLTRMRELNDPTLAGERLPAGIKFEFEENFMVHF